MGKGLHFDWHSEMPGFDKDWSFWSRWYRSVRRGGLEVFGWEGKVLG